MSVQQASFSPVRYEPVQQAAALETDPLDTEVAVTGSHEEMNSLTGKFVYAITRPIAIACFYPLTFPSLLNLKGLAGSVASCRERLQDFGGEFVQIRSTDGAELDGMFFDPTIFQERRQTAFDKWKILFGQPDYAR